MERERPGAVIYCSYETTSRAITVEGARDCARAAAKAGAKFVFISSDLVFDGAAGNYTESAPARPIFPYGHYKLEAEGHVKVAHPEALVARPALLVGESGVMLRPSFECTNLMRGQPVNLYSDEWRSAVHVDDVARAVWDLLIKDVSGLFHVGGPRRLSRLEIGRLLCAMHRFDPALVREAKRPPDRPRDTSLDSTRITNLLGWAPRALQATAPLAAAGV